METPSMETPGTETPGIELEPLGERDPRELGPYHLRGRLRVGRAGIAYLGRSPDGLFAEVTVVSEQIAWDPEVLALLSYGTDAARRLRAPHLQRVRAADLGERTPWTAADFLPGPLLRDAVEAYGPLPPAAVRSLATVLADALDAVHGAGHVHRGLDPSTVVLTADGAVVTGLGVARALEAATVTLPRLVPDAVAYLPPEVARGLEAGSPADVFGLGAVLTYAATGHGPFGSGASAELARRMRDDEPDLAGLPDDLVEVVTACVRADPGRRPTLAAVRRRLAAGPVGSWVLPDGLTGAFAQWAVLGRGRSAPLAPAIPAEPTAPLAPQGGTGAGTGTGSGAGPAATRRLDIALDGSGAGGVGDTENLGGAPTAPAGALPASSGADASAAPPRPVSILPRTAGDDRGSGSGRGAGQGGSRVSPLLLVAVGVAVAALVFAAVTVWL